MATKIISDGIDETLKNAAQHGQPEHGRKEFNEDIVEGAHAKTRDVKSPQIRGGKAGEKNVVKPVLGMKSKKTPAPPILVSLAQKQKRKALNRWENEGGQSDEQGDIEQ